MSACAKEPVRRGRATAARPRHRECEGAHDLPMCSACRNLDEAFARAFAALEQRRREACKAR